MENLVEQIKALNSILVNLLYASSPLSEKEEKLKDSVTTKLDSLIKRL